MKPWLTTSRRFLFGRPATGKRPSRRHHLTLEYLEDRLSPSVTSSVDAFGVLTISADGMDDIAVTSSLGAVQVNGADPDSGPATSNSITEVNVTLTGNFANQVDLTGVFSADFALLTSISVVDGGGSDTVRANDNINFWSVVGVNAGVAIDAAATDFYAISFTDVENLTAGAGSDTFAFADGAGVAGTVTGGGGTDLLDYTAYSTPVSVDLGAATATGTGGIGGVEDVLGGSAGDSLTAANDGIPHTLDGQGGDDTYFFPAAVGGADLLVTIQDTSGTDRVNFSGAGYGVTVDLDLTGSAQDLDGAGAENDSVTLAAFTEIENVTGSPGNDDLSVDASTSVISRDVGGGGGSDTLHYDVGAGQNPNVASAGISFAAPSTIAPLTFSGIATLDVVGTPTGEVVFDGGTGADELTVTASDPDTASYVFLLNGGATSVSGSLDLVTLLRVNGGDGDDTLTLNNPAGDLFAPGSGIRYDGGLDNDLLNLTGAGAVGGSTETYQTGVSAFFGDGASAGTVNTVKTSTQDLQFTGIEALNTDLVVDTYTVNGNDLTNTVDVLDEADDAGTRVRVAVGGTVAADFSGKTNVVVNAGDGTAGGDLADTVTVNFANAPAAFASLQVNADEGADQVNVRAIRVATVVYGNDGNDTFSVGSAGNSLDGLLDTLSANGDGDSDRLHVNDQGDADANDFTLTGTTIDRSGAGQITYGTLEALVVNAGDGANTVTVQATHAGTTAVHGNGAADTVNVQTNSGAVTVSGGTGDDTFNVGNGGNSLDGLGATVTLDGTSGTADYLNVNDQGDATNQSYTLTAIALTRTATPAIQFSNLDGLTVNAGSGTNTLQVSQTKPSNAMPVRVNGNSGTDTLLAPNVTNTWLVSGASSGTLTGSAGSVVTFNLGGGTNNLTGGALGDHFNFNGGSLSGAVNGGAGSDSLTLTTAVASTFQLTGANAGSTSGGYAIAAFSAVENLTGGTGSDAFVFANGAGLSGKIHGGGGGRDWLDYSAYATAVVVNLATNSATGVSGGLVGGTGIVNVRGGAGADVFTGDANSNILVGGGGNDRLTGGAGMDVLIGGGGADALDGGIGEDLLVGGSTNLDGNNASLENVRATWTGGGTIAARQTAINGLWTVANDGVSDRLTGGADTGDLFYYSVSDILADFLSGTDERTLI